MESRLAQLRLLLIFAVAFSLVVLPGSLTGGLGLPSLQLGRANPAPIPCHTLLGINGECWYPAGPAMDTLLVPIFTDGTAELNCFQQTSPCVDLTDTPLSASIIPSLDTNPKYYVTSQMSEHAYYEIQFLLPNNFWGVYMNFGNNPNGTLIRQGIAHLADKASFVNSQTQCSGGQCIALDNPVPANNGGLPAPNPCKWDTGVSTSVNFTEIGTNCIVGSPGGTAYHLASATGVNFPWQPALSSPDFCAAADHFIAAGLATGKDAVTCVLTGLSPNVTAHTVNFFIRVDDTTRFQLGESIAQEICALFGQGFVTGCSPYLTVTPGPASAFPGPNGNGCISTSICLSWHIYTGGYNAIYPFDQSLYFTYNSRFVSGIPGIKQPNGPCSAAAVGTFNPRNYMYLCNPGYDNISSLIETARCSASAGDPAPGQAGPTFSNCSGGRVSGSCTTTSDCTAVSAGYQTEDLYGRNEFSIPIYDRNDQFGYLSNWQRVINADGAGIPNFFTWLDAYSPNPATAGTVRQGFFTNTRSLSPYIASTTHDFYVLRNIYDSLSIANPLDGTQMLDWMGVTIQAIGNNSIPATAAVLGYTPPAGTLAALRVTLRGADLFWQSDASGSHPAKRVTSWDVAFSYLSLLGTGAYQSSGAGPTTGLTIMSPSSFDLDLSSLGPYTQYSELGLTILPGQFWSGAGQSSWNNAIDSTVSTCANQRTASGVLSCYSAQYTFSTSAMIGTSTVPSVVCADNTIRSGASGCSHVPASLLNVDTNKIGATYDPIATGNLIGSGPWECVSGSGIVGTGCTPACFPGPCQTIYTLTRYGKGNAPGEGLSSHYFRSNGNLALWIWSGDNGDFTHDFVNLQVASGCYGLQAQPLGSTGACAHWQQGIGANGGPIAVGIVQISIIVRFVAVNWVAPFNWQSNLPNGIASFAPVLYEDGMTLRPASVAGCTQPYPAGGYDC